MNKIIGIMVVIILVLGGLFLFGRDGSLRDSFNSVNQTKTADQNEIKTLPVATTAIDSGAVKEFTIFGDPFFFSPTIIKVKNGDTVKITFKNNEGFHDLKIDEFNVATQKIKAGDEEMVTFVADKVGSFDYYCSVGDHRAKGMVGTIVVE